MVKKHSNTKLYIKLPLLMALAISGGIIIGATMVDTDQKSNELISSILKFKEILTYVERDYVDEVNTPGLVEDAIGDMLKNLDPHSVYIPAKDLEVTQSQLEGEFEGIGIEFNIIRDTIYVVAALSGGPSEKVGLQSGDKIIKVDGEIVAGIGINIRGVIDRLRGKKGSEVEVEIQRSKVKKPLQFTIIRDKIPQHSVDVSYMVDDKIGYIKISRFASSTYAEFREALVNLVEQGMEKLILDLQSNPGGYLDKAVGIADEFLPDNQMIVYTEGKQKRYDSQYRAHRRGLFESQPLIILINQGSASASEIVSGALQDNDRALVVGRRSFGKGLVQIPISLQDSSEIRLTVSRYYTPSGRSIQKPYAVGEDGAYELELLERYNQGEYFHKDSVKFDDSLKYTTSKGRAVYGGGGIMPDIFVPIDTTENSNYLSRLFASTVIREYTLKYFENNKDKIKKMSLKNYQKQFKVTDNMLKDVVRMAEEAGIDYNESEFMRSKEIIKTNIKATIARSMWQNEGFFRVIHEIDDIYQTALEVFDQAEALAKQ